MIVIPRKSSVCAGSSIEHALPLPMLMLHPSAPPTRRHAVLDIMQLPLVKMRQLGAAIELIHTTLSAGSPADQRLASVMEEAALKCVAFSPSLPFYFVGAMNATAMVGAAGAFAFGLKEIR